MASLALGVVAWGRARYELLVATTMGRTTLSPMHVGAALEAREPKGTIFARTRTIENGRFLEMFGAAVVPPFLVTALAPLERILGTTSPTTRQWGICLLAPIALLRLLELGKLIDRRVGARPEARSAPGIQDQALIAVADGGDRSRTRSARRPRWHPCPRTSPSRSSMPGDGPRARWSNVDCGAWRAE
jgi:hypothetical protein